MASESTNSTSHGLGTIATALVGVLGALVGGAITGAVTYLSTTQQIKSTAAESRVEFYRKEKKDLYTALLTDAAATNQPIESYAADFAGSNDPRSADFNNAHRDVAPAVEKVRDDYNAIRVLGSSAVDSAKNVWDKVLDHAGAIDNLYRQWANGGLSEQDRRSSYVPFSAPQKAAVQAEDDFAIVAHRDLESTQ